jgi:hypothetical protein
LLGVLTKVVILLAAEHGLKLEINRGENKRDTSTFDFKPPKGALVTGRFGFFGSKVRA